MSGLTFRRRRIFRNISGRLVLVPMDHGMTMGPIPGLLQVRSTAEAVVNAGADGIVVHKGVASHVGDLVAPKASLFVHVSASTLLGTTVGHKVTVCSVEEAVRLGADAVSAHINLGDPTEPEQLRELGAISDRCHAWGVPLLVMTYPRGPLVPDECAPEAVAHAVRVAAELGADLVKTNYTGDPITFRQAIAGCHVPVLIAGGALGPDALVKTVEQAVEAGAAGVSIGRGVFGHSDPADLIRRISHVVHQPCHTTAEV